MWGETGGCDCNVSTSLFEPMVRKARGLVDFGKRSLTHKAQATEKAHCPLMSNSKKVAARGVEPRRLSAPDPKSGVSANFTKRPLILRIAIEF